MKEKIHRPNRRGLRALLPASLLLLVLGAIVAAVFVAGRRGAAPAPPAAPSPRTAPPAARVPPEIGARLDQARRSIQSGRSAEAIPVLEEALREGAARSLDAAALSSVSHMLAVELRRIGKRDEALAQAAGWLAAHPDDVPHLLVAGTLFYEQGRYKDAIERLEKGLAAPRGEIARLATDILDVFCQLAECYRATGQGQKAREIVDRVLAENPRHRAARRTLGLIASGLKDYPLALATFEGLHREDPSDGAAAYQLARLSLDMGKAPRAIEAIRACRATGKPWTPDLRLLHAKALVEAKEPAKAVGEAASILIVDPDLDEAYFVLANALSRSDLVDLAQPFRERYARLAPFRVELERAQTALAFGAPESAAYYRGRAYLLARRYGPAMTDLTEARRLAPYNGQVAAALAELLLAVDRPLDAMDYLDTFEASCRRAKIEPAAEFFLARARAALELGSAEQAVRAIERATQSGRCEREICEAALRVALRAGDASALLLALPPFRGKEEVDPDAQALAGTKSLLEGDRGRAEALLGQVVATVPEPPAPVLLAAGRAFAASGKRAEAAAMFRRLIDEEELIREAHDGLREASDEQDERDRAASWLSGAERLEAALKEEGARIRGEAGARPCAEALLRISNLRRKLGQPERARAGAAMARDLDPLNVPVHRWIVLLFDRPDEAFVRLHSLEALLRLTPDDPTIEPRRRDEYGRLGFEVPPAEAAGKG